MSSLAEAIASSRATLRLAETAAILGIDPETASRGAREGSIPSIRIGRRVLVPRIPLLAILLRTRRERPPTAQVLGVAEDASVVAVSATGDRILTGDAGDIRPLVVESGRSVLVVPC